MLLLLLRVYSKSFPNQVSLLSVQVQHYPLGNDVYKTNLHASLILINIDFSNISSVFKKVYTL